MSELTWEGKYVDGETSGPVRIPLPFQTIETINESAQDRQRGLSLYSEGRDLEWRDRLIWGDKKYVLPSLLPEFAGRVDVVYIDPPFDTGANFSFTAAIPEDPSATEDEQAEFTKQPSIVEQKAYRDTWGHGLESYLPWLSNTLVLLRELLAETGSIFVHLDVHKGPYVKVLMDEIFGIENFQNEIVWYYYNKLHDSRKRRLPKATDQILYYVKSRDADYTYHPLKEPRETPITKLKYKKVKGKIQNVIGEDGKAVTYTSEERTVDNVWRIRALQPANLKEWVNFETQKPVDLIERILAISSDEGDLVLDCFCGSGSSLIAAAKNNRRWIGADLGRFAIHTSRKRLLNLPGIKPFVVQNLGKYERQAWQAAEFPSNGGDRLKDERQREQSYRRFILDTYLASPVEGYIWLHGLKSGRFVHVGAVDAPVTASDVRAIARETWRAASTGKDSASFKAGADILGWDWAFEVNELAKQVAAESRVTVAFKKIPREVLDKKAVEQGDVKFFELGALTINAKLVRRRLSLTLADFIIPIDDIPEEVRVAIRHWSQLVDYWAVDWDYRNDTFHNQWQSFRTRLDPSIQLATEFTYDEPGNYTVVAKVIDILGNDTTKTLEFKVN